MLGTPARPVSNQACGKKDGVHCMGISIHMAISTSTTREEWRDVYQETLQLARAFPLAELREELVRGVPTTCLVPTVEREYSYGRHRKASKGWRAAGDYRSCLTAETFALHCAFDDGRDYEADAPDAMFASVPEHVQEYDWNDERFHHCHFLWGNKTQGEPYHMYLLAIACMVASRLGRKAYVYGDITKGQCERAVRMANEYLDHGIGTPDQCDVDRLFARINDMPLAQSEKTSLLVGSYLGRKDAAFGAHVRSLFSERTWDEYWVARFHGLQMSTLGFDRALYYYLQWGFDLEKLWSLACGQDDNNLEQYEVFVNKVMDAKLHQLDKDCADPLEIDPDGESPYGIWTLFAQFALAGARNKKVDRYIPIEEIRAMLSRAIGDRCPVDELIDEYLQREADQMRRERTGEDHEGSLRNGSESDASSALAAAMKSYKGRLEDISRAYDIARPEHLPYYEAGDAVKPELLDAVGDSVAFCKSLLEEDTYSELMAKAPIERCRWLSQENRSLVLRDKDWEKIYDDIMDCPESFGRYYPLMRVRLDSEELCSMVRALAINDALYTHASELAVSARE